jgi:hypothetical protein
MTATFTAPDWLARRGAALRRGLSEASWLVLFDRTPQYRLDVRPAMGRFACAVTQTVNGRRLDRGGNFSDADAALQGGLEDLREVLGW